MKKGYAPRKKIKNKGAYNELKEMEPMTVKFMAEGTLEDAVTFRSMATQLSKYLETNYTILFRRGKIYAIRYE